MLYEYLKENYNVNEPIFISDIDLPVKSNYLRQMFKTLCDNGKIKRYDTGIYYIPGASRLKGGSVLSTKTVARYKYVSRNGNVDGYYSGYTFANQLGITTQVPNVTEIVSNGASANTREISMNGQRIMLRKPKTEVNKQNYQVLQFLDLLKDIDRYADYEVENLQELIAEYVQRSGITKENIDRYIRLYPDKTYRNFYEMRLYNVFA